MSKIEYTINPINIIDTYTIQYREYYEDLYSDTGIYGERQIIENYLQSAIDRQAEIYDLIEQRLSPDIVLGRTIENTLFLSWRSKTLFVAWEDE
jgi:hypothetical protein